MLNIAIDARPLTNPIDGIARYTYELTTRLLNEQKFSWHLYAHRPLVHRIVGANVRIANQTAANSIVASQSLFPRWAKEDAIDVFWSPRHHIPHALSIPSVVTIHDLCWKFCPNSMPLPRRMIERLLTPPSISKASQVMTVSHAVREQIVEQWPSTTDRIRVIQPGPQKFETSTATSQNAPYVIAVGTVEPRKNYPLLFSAFAQAATKVPHNLVVVGRNGWNHKRLDSLIRQHKLESRVTVLEEVSDDQLGTLYKGADWLVTASAYEGFNLPILEALNLGTPIIASDLPVHREVADRAGVFFALRQEALAKTLIKHLSTSATQADYAKEASKVVSKYDWNRSVDQVLDTFERAACSA